MKNEEKAKSLWFNFCTEKSCDGHNDCESCPKAKIHPQLIEMAEWKEQEIIKWLKENLGSLLNDETSESSKSLTIDLFLSNLKQKINKQQ